MSDLPEVLRLLPLSETDAQRLDRARQIHRQGLEELVPGQSLNRIIDVHHKLIALQGYIKQAMDDLGMKLLAANELAELRLRQERLVGEWLSENISHTGGNPQLSHDGTVGRLPAGINRNRSSRWQISAQLPVADFESYLRETIERGQELTSAAVYRRARKFAASQDRLTWLVRPRETAIVEQMSALIEDGKRFGTIYADPPWPYDNQRTRGATDQHYRTMSLEDMAKLPVKRLAEDNAHLHLWTTNAFGFEAREIMEAWGFEYRSCFVWVKPDMGLGNYWRVATEFLLLGVRGSCPFRENNIDNYLFHHSLGHSQKPEEVRRRIERVSPPTYIELFGRRVAEGWTVLGDEIDVTWFDEPRIIRPIQGELLQEVDHESKRSRRKSRKK
jgi:N6-adenosine-specific RNA methylase IME4